MLPQLMAMGVRRSRSRAASAAPPMWQQVTRVWRAAIDLPAAAARPRFQCAGWTQALAAHAEGQQHTLGAYDRPWR
jgi:collagenase-like PrtC family protease